MMYKRILIFLLFVLITSPVFSAGSSGGSSGGDAKPVTQYEIALKMKNKAKKFEMKIDIIAAMYPTIKPIIIGVNALS